VAVAESVCRKFSAGRFGGEHRPGVARYLAQRPVRLCDLAFFYQPVYLAVRVQRDETFLEPLPAAQHHRLAGDDRGLRLRACRYQLRGQVAAADVLVECGADVGSYGSGDIDRWGGHSGTVDGC